MTNRGAYILLGFVMTLGLFCSGCATGPKYLYTEQKDSASVGVGQTSAPEVKQTHNIGSVIWSRFWHGSATASSPYDGNGNPYAGNGEVNIDKIDGLEAGFPSGQWGQIGELLDNQRVLWDKAGKVWISPGRHTLAVTTTQDQEVTYGPLNDGTVGPSEQWYEIATGTIDAEFAANHIYRLTTSSGSDATLWDETDGVANRSVVGTWAFNGKRKSYDIDTTSAPSP